MIGRLSTILLDLQYMSCSERSAVSYSVLLTDITGATSIDQLHMKRLNSPTAHQRTTSTKQKLVWYNVRSCRDLIVQQAPDIVFIEYDQDADTIVKVLS